MKHPLWKVGASYGPEAVKVMGEAFDRAWLAIADNFGNDEHDIQSARGKLAEALLSVAGEQSMDPEALKNRALQEMALQYRGPATSPKVGAKLQAARWRRLPPPVGARARVSRCADRLSGR